MNKIFSYLLDLLKSQQGKTKEVGKGSATLYLMMGGGVFIKEQMCGLLGNWKKYSLVEFNAKSKTPLINGRPMIGLGPADQAGKSIGNLRNYGTGRPLVGALMGLAINVAQSRNAEGTGEIKCGHTWGGAESKKDKLSEWRENEKIAEKEGWGEVFDIVMKARSDCINKSKQRWNQKRAGGLERSFERNEGWKIEKTNNNPQLIFDEKRKITDAKKLRLKGKSKWVPWAAATELPYTYE